MLPRSRTVLRAAARATLVAWAVGAHSLAAQIPTLDPSDPEQQVRGFVEAVREMPFIAPGRLAAGRELSGPIPDDVRRKHRDAMLAARRLTWRPELLAESLRHDDPKVRLMAAWGLYQLADARWLPALGALAGDRGSIPSRLLLIGALNYEEIESWHREHPVMQSTTVGDEVLGWLAGWDAPPPGGIEFDAWCARQQELAPTAACLRVKLKLATKGVGSTSRWEAQPLLDVLRAAQGAPRGAAEIAQVALLSDKYHDLRGFYPDIESHLEFAGRRLGRENVLRLIHGEPPVVDDVPLDAVSYAGFEDGFARFVLERPGRVGLEPVDAEVLLALGRETGRLACFRAAARLRPEDALAILREALGRPVDHLSGLDFADCALLLWDLRPEQGADFLADWFHADPEGRPRVYPPHRQRLAVHLLTKYGLADRRMFARLVADPRFDAAPPSALEAMLRTLNLTRLDPIVAEEGLSGLHHPLGLDRAFGDLPAAREQYPEATEVMVAALAGWRRAIREHVESWR